MCDPISLAISAAVLTTAGSAINRSEQEDNIRSQNEARQSKAQAEVKRQQAFAQEGEPMFKSALAKTSPQGQEDQLQTAQTARRQASDASVSADYAPSTTGSSSSVVNSEIADRMAEAVRKAKKSGQDRADLSAWGDVGNADRINFSDINSNLGMIGNLSRGSQSLLPFEQEIAARNAAKPPSGLGDFLSLLGSGASMAGGTGAFGGGGGGYNPGQISWNGPRAAGF